MDGLSYTEGFIEENLEYDETGLILVDFIVSALTENEREVLEKRNSSFNHALLLRLGAIRLNLCGRDLCRVCPISPCQYRQ